MHCGFGCVGAKKTDVKLVKRLLVGFVVVVVVVL
jgi:hypothetical protein